MSDEIKTENQMSMREMLDSLEGSLKRIHSGDVVKGTVLSVNDEEAFVNIGYMADGIISKEELSDDETAAPKDMLNPGDEVDVYILEVNDGDGNVALSLKRASYYKAWDEFADSLNNGAKIQVKISEVVKGGVVAQVKGIRCFIPASQLSLNYVENMQDFLGRTLEVKVIEMDREKEKVVLSRKEVEKEEAELRKNDFWSTIKKGEKRSGVVKRLAKFGAFVDIGGVDGLIHISDLSWKRILDPAEVVSVGDKVEVYVLDYDKAKGRISLGLKEVNKNPWEKVASKYKVGDTVDGRVVKLMDFGAFVELEDGVEGLVHLTNISEERINKPSLVLKVNDPIKVKILEIDLGKKKMSLSIKDAASNNEEDYSSYNQSSSSGLTLGDLFKDKFKDFK